MPNKPNLAEGEINSKGLQDINKLAYDNLARSIREELIKQLNGNVLAPSVDDQDEHLSKDVLRAYQAMKREEYRQRENEIVKKYGRELIGINFADGTDVDPYRIQPELIVVRSDTKDSYLFRLATLLWSVPVSHGYGRRIRFLVRDKSNGKLIGIFGLTDPVFNIRARDEWIGWNVHDRRERLVNIMDAFVVGAVPPYNQLIGGKLIASLMTSDEVVMEFRRKYGNTVGIISGKEKHAELVLITVTSALGRSSLYNRLTLPGLLKFERIGFTKGWGHFQVPQPLFTKMREMLEIVGHKYASGHRYGDGPNWRMRVSREAITRVGLDPDTFLRHGIEREIFACPLVAGWKEYLSGNIHTIDVTRPSAAQIGTEAVKRWLIPRAERRSDYRSWSLDETWRMIVGHETEPLQGQRSLPGLEV